VCEAVNSGAFVQCNIHRQLEVKGSLVEASIPHSG
jgi:hypothetical protein